MLTFITTTQAVLLFYYFLAYDIEGTVGLLTMRACSVERYLRKHAHLS